MTNLTVGNLLLMRIWCSDAEQASVNNIWYSVAAVGAPAATDFDVATQMNALLAPLYKPILSELAAFRGVQVQIHTNTPAYPAVNSVVFDNSLNGPGTGGPTALPRQTCGLGSFSTNFPGRQFRGRVYFPFPGVEADDGTGKPIAGYVAAIQTITDDLSTGVSIVESTRTATLVRALVHVKAPKSGIRPVPTPVTGGSASFKWATQRRRGSFGRPNLSPI